MNDLSHSSDLNAYEKKQQAHPKLWESEKIIA